MLETGRRQESADRSASEVQTTVTGAFIVAATPLEKGDDKPPYKRNTADLLIKAQAGVEATDAQIAFYHRIRQTDSSMRRIIFPDGDGCRKPLLMSREEWNRRRFCHNDYVLWMVDTAQPGLGFAKPQVPLADRGLDVVCWDLLTRFGKDTRTRVLRRCALALGSYVLLGFLLLWLFYGASRHYETIPDGLEILRPTPRRLVTYGAGLLGAAFGAWLVRTYRAQADDWPTLVTTASDPMQSWVRAAFVLLFASAAILMLRAGVITFEVAGLLDSDDAFPRQLLPGEQTQRTGSFPHRSAPRTCGPHPARRGDRSRKRRRGAVRGSSFGLQRSYGGTISEACGWLPCFWPP